jgi:hypothetical protein
VLDADAKRLVPAVDDGLTKASFTAFKRATDCFNLSSSAAGAFSYSFANLRIKRYLLYAFVLL